MSHIERANSRAFSPVPLAADPKDAPSMRYTGFRIGISYRIKKAMLNELFPQLNIKKFINLYFSRKTSLTSDERGETFQSPPNMIQNKKSLSNLIYTSNMTNVRTRIILVMISCIVVLTIKTSFPLSVDLKILACAKWKEDLKTNICITI